MTKHSTGSRPPPLPGGHACWPKVTGSSRLIQRHGLVLCMVPRVCPRVHRGSAASRALPRGSRAVRGRAAPLRLPKGLTATLWLQGERSPSIDSRAALCVASAPSARCMGPGVHTARHQQAVTAHQDRRPSLSESGPRDGGPGLAETRHRPVSLLQGRLVCPASFSSSRNFSPWTRCGGRAVPVPCVEVTPSPESSLGLT